MAKKQNEVNGVLVYRRWCVGAILSALLLLVVAAGPALLAGYRWLTINNGSTQMVLRGSNLFDLIYWNGPIKGFFDHFGAQFVNRFIVNNAFNSLLADMRSQDALMFGFVNTAILWVFFVFILIIGVLVVVDLVMFIFYVATGRIVNPAAPVKLSWAITVFMAIFAGGTFGYTLLLNVGAAKISTTLSYNFLFPIFFAGGNLLASILLSIIYVVSFKDKFYIGRAKRFGSGGTNQYPNQQPIYGGPNQPQVIIVNGTPTQTAAAPILMTAPAQQNQNGETQPAPVQVITQPETPVTPRGVLPTDLKSVGGHAFSKNLDLKYADIPSGIKELGVGAFANCLNLEIVSLPKSVKRIKKNCFFNCVKLARINYAGSKSEWRYVVRGSNWLDRAGTRTVVCSDGAIIVDPHR